MSEVDRLTIIENRDGKAAAIDFAKRTYSIYRKALMISKKRGSIKQQEDQPNVLIHVKFEKLSNVRPKTIHHASLPEFRRSFIESCVVFRRYLESADER